jgi:hypothetical protein
LFTDNEGYVERITLMSERVCGVCLDFLTPPFPSRRI